MEQLKRAAAQALKHARDHRRGGGRRWKSFTKIDICRLRRDLNLTQQQFCRRYGFEIDTLKSWELGRRFPDQANSFILAMIEAEPQLLCEMVERISADQRLAFGSSDNDPEKDRGEHVNVEASIDE
ncbi:helix-turn-helix domain-containing protein [Bradyrhizobium oligotrophicum]|uniref:helix-turn-helix domain-containing protein n=1 Tax=Bradyrhizobium oligotrophicum TaxID=44255 RepID=UPI003EBC4CF6